MTGRNCGSQGITFLVQRRSQLGPCLVWAVVIALGRFGAAQDGSTDSNSDSSTPLPVVIQFNGPPNEGGLTFNPLDLNSGVVITSPLISQPTFNSMAVTQNQHEVATALDSINGKVTGNTALVMAQIQGLSPAAQQSALSSLSGEVYGTLQTLGLQMGDRTLRVVSNRIINNDVFLNDGENMLFGQNDDSSSGASSSIVVRGQPPMAGSSAWAQGFGGTGYLSSNGNASGLGYRMGGFAVGIDLARDESGVIGITGGTDSMSFHTGLGDVGQVQSYQLGAYALKRLENVYGFGVINYGHNDYSVTRNIQIGDLGQTSSSNPMGNQFGSYGEIGVTLDACPFRFQPFFGLQYLYLANGSAFENGASGVTLTASSSSISTFQTHLGARLIQRTWRDGHGIDWTPYLTGVWVAELLGQQAAAVTSLSGAPAGASWVAAGNQSGRNFGSIGPGVTARVTEGISFFANYDMVFGARFQTYTASGGVLLEF